MDKFICGGKVAVIYSPGYGAGWSTWNSGETSKIMVFHPRLVEALQRKASEEEAKAILQDICKDDYICVLGWDKAKIEWIPQGQCFVINEYDGNESIEFAGNERWMTA